MRFSATKQEYQRQKNLRSIVHGPSCTGCKEGSQLGTQKPSKRKTQMKNNKTIRKG